MRAVITTCVSLIAAISMVWLHVRLDRLIKTEIPDQSKQTLPSAQSVKLCSLGYDRFLADMFWLAFVQYLGEIRDRGKGYVSAYDYVNLITDLDPHFVKAYWFGCWAVGYWQKRPDLADKIIQRGMQANPTDWYLPYLGGINMYIFGHEYKKAAAYYRRAAKLPDAPDYLERHAEILDSPMPQIEKRFQTLGALYYRSKDEDLRASVRPQLVETLREMYKTALTPAQKQTAVTHLKYLGERVPN